MAGIASEAQGVQPAGPAASSDAFISYASQDQAIATAVCTALERAGVVCWIAPRDVSPGEFYAEEIVRGIDGTRLVVLVLSQNAVASPHVLREVERASSKRHPVVTLRVDLAPLPAALEYFLNTSHWLDASASGVEPALPKLVEAVTRLTAHAAGAAPDVALGLAMPAPAPSTHRADGIPPARRPRRALIALGAVAALGLASLAVGRHWIAAHLAPQRFSFIATPGAAVPEQSIAVLPFVNMSGDARNDYLGEGLSEELSNRLTKIAQLRVAARTSVFAIKGKGLDVGEIATRLGVRYIVQGSIKRQADRLRVTAALVDGATGSNRWSNAYQPGAADFFTVEDDIAAQVMQALELVLAERPGPAPARPGGGSPAAYDLYLQGLASLRQPRSARTLAAAEQLFERALAEQPAFSRAQAGLCEARVQRYEFEKVPAYVGLADQACANAEALDSDAAEVHLAVGRLRLATGEAAAAEVSFRRALALVPLSPDALIGLGDALDAGGNAAEAERTYQRAIAVQPQYATAQLACGNFLLAHGRPAEAVPLYQRAGELTPDNPSAFSNLGGAYFQMGDLERAAAAFEHSLTLEPRRASYSNAGTVRYYLGQYAAAAELYRKAIELAPADHRLWGNLADALLYGAHPDEAPPNYRRALELAEGELAVNPKHAVNQAQAAYYAARLGAHDKARQFLATAIAEGAGDYQAQYYVALAALGLGDRPTALAHARLARKLGYPENLMRVAPELGDIRKML
ncbi:MAG TPA: tetratricopeptide repeat protein [Steroidobacteraceae bacterium]|nr:tetratricopeptide repeat protein [Steroidobacteraceae bacterium]